MVDICRALDGIRVHSACSIGSNPPSYPSSRAPHIIHNTCRKHSCRRAEERTKCDSPPTRRHYPSHPPSSPNHSTKFCHDYHCWSPHPPLSLWGPKKDLPYRKLALFRGAIPRQPLCRPTLHRSVVCQPPQCPAYQLHLPCRQSLHGRIRDYCQGCATSCV